MRLMIQNILFILGLFLVFGAAGNLELDPNAGVIAQFALVLVGLGMMCAVLPIQEV